MQEAFFSTVILEADTIGHNLRELLYLILRTVYLKAGLSIGFQRGEDHVNILINLPAARAEGGDLDAALLRLAEVYR
ncbi:MAG TPA: YfiR/HmsC family protein [Pseudomonadota bacterium]|nr:YfiR/HmsC family protein [Pseudomonadota bacterium]